MIASRTPESSQTGIHDRLDEVVRRHLDCEWKQPVRAHARRAFVSVCDRAESARQLVLDAGCGTGASTISLAECHPDALVLGVDKSADRLGRAPRLPENVLLLRAELADFWRLARAAGWRLQHHYLFYPNPWPKPAHLMRRWHAHPVFPDLLALGGQLELRSNFEIYVQEFARALELAGVDHAKVVSFEVEKPVSPFERKYAQSGHRLWKLTANLQGVEP